MPHAHVLTPLPCASLPVTCTPCKLVSTRNLLFLYQIVDVHLVTGIPGGGVEAPGKGRDGATGESAARGGVLLNSAYFISELSMAGPLAAIAVLPPDPIPVDASSLTSGCYIRLQLSPAGYCVHYTDADQNRAEAICD